MLYVMRCKLTSMSSATRQARETRRGYRGREGIIYLPLRTTHAF
jgi:hypothetical protein